MNNLDLEEVCDFVNTNIALFHNARLERLKSLNLKDLLKKKNPCLFKAKNVLKASELVNGILDAFISSSEEKMFGDFLESLAIFVCEKAYKGFKSSSSGIDLEFELDNVRYLVSVKSGPNWGNSSQISALRTSFLKAKKILNQSRQIKNIQPVLGICYGKTKTTNNGLYLKITGQNFWYFITGSRDFYIDIIKPIGYKAKKHCERYDKEKTRVYNKFTKDFLDNFCTEGLIDWQALVSFNSGNYQAGNGIYCFQESV